MVTVLRIARVKTGMSLRAFAKALEMPESTLCKIERGVQYVPPLWRDKLAAAVGLAVQEICDLDGMPLREREARYEANHS
jgi:transcriptional regulator with XRE-family HTH domain